MNRWVQFLRSTLVGGIFFLVPVILLIVIVGKAIEIASEVVDPLAKLLPIHSMIGLPMPVFIAALLILLFCFISGVFARTRRAARFVAALEGDVLTNVPGYEFFKDIGQGVMGVTPQHVRQTVMVRLDESWQIAFLMERAGEFVTVFVPDAPSSRTGAVHVISDERMRETSVSPAAALKVLRRLGSGSGDLVSKLMPPREAPAMPARGDTRET